MKRREFAHHLTALLGVCALGVAHASDEAPDAMVKRISTEVLDAVKADAAIQAGDVGRITALVDSKIMPNVNFSRMTASAVGRFWRQASPEQQKRLEQEFKTLLVRTYSGALTQVKDQTLSFRPLRAAPTDTEVVVRTEVRGRGDPIQLDYRLEKADTGCTSTMLKLPSQLTHDQVSACLRQWRGQWPLGDGPVLVDASDLTRFD